jgi:hypothetical protein
MPDADILDRNKKLAWAIKKLFYYLRLNVFYVNLSTQFERFAKDSMSLKLSQRGK